MADDDSDAELIPADAYKQLVPHHRRRAAAFMLAGMGLLSANRILELCAPELRGAVLVLVDQLEEATKSGDLLLAFASAHEIRGLAATAGLDTTGRIANGFCTYLDAIGELGLEADALVVNLHLGAIVRSARTADDDTARHSDAVAEQLAALVQRKLAEVKDSKRP